MSPPPLTCDKLDWAALDRLRGRFRSFLCGALVRFLADEYDRRRAQKRGSGAVHLSINEATALPAASVPGCTS